MSRTASPLTPLEVHPPISQNDEVSTSKKPSSRVVKNHPESNIIGSLDDGLRFRKGNKLLANHVTYHCYLAQFEPKKVEEALQDENWVESMHEELNQFVRLLLGLKVFILSAPNGSSKTRPMKMERLSGINLGQWLKDTLKQKELILMNPSLQWQGLSLFAFSCQLHAP